MGRWDYEKLFLNIGVFSVFKAAMPRKRPPAEDSAGGPSKEGTAEESIPSKKKALDSKFGGMTEEQVMELLLPDHLAQGLDIIFVREAAGGWGVVSVLGALLLTLPSVVDRYQPRSLLCLHWPSL